MVQSMKDISRMASPATQVCNRCGQEVPHSHREHVSTPEQNLQHSLREVRQVRKDIKAAQQLFGRYFVFDADKKVLKQIEEKAKEEGYKALNSALDSVERMKDEFKKA